MRPSLTPESPQSRRNNDLTVAQGKERRKEKEIRKETKKEMKGKRREREKKRKKKEEGKKRPTFFGGWMVTADFGVKEM